MLDNQRCDPLIVGFVDFDYVGDLDYKRSSTGYAFTLASGPICQKSIIQSLEAMSTTEVKYITVAMASKETVWLERVSE